MDGKSPAPEAPQRDWGLVLEDTIVAHFDCRAGVFHSASEAESLLLWRASDFWSNFGATFFPYKVITTTPGQFATCVLKVHQIFSFSKFCDSIFWAFLNNLPLPHLVLQHRMQKPKDCNVNSASDAIKFSNAPMEVRQFNTIQKLILGLMHDPWILYWGTSHDLVDQLYRTYRVPCPCASMCQDASGSTCSIGAVCHCSGIKHMDLYWPGFSTDFRMFFRGQRWEHVGNSLQAVQKWLRNDSSDTGSHHLSVQWQWRAIAALHSCDMSTDYFTCWCYMYYSHHQA